MAEQETLPCSPAAVFDAIESGALPGWKLAAGLSLRVGSLLSLSVLLPRTMGGRKIEVLGRIVELVVGRKLVVEYHMPWRGRVSISTFPLGFDQCRVRIVAQIDDQTVDWLMRAGGASDEHVVTPGGTSGRSPLGLIVSSSGPANIFAGASENLAVLAVEELNSVDGFGPSGVELHVGDDGTNPALGAAELVRLARAGCRVIVTNVTSATMSKLRPLARKLGLLLIHTPVNEGGVNSAEIFRMGERPWGQLRRSVPWIMKSTGAKNWYLAGNDYSWPHVANAQAQFIIKRRGGHVVGESYRPLGTRDFTPMLESIAQSSAELVISTFVGADEVAFEQQFYEADLRRRIRTLSLAMDESTREHVGAAAGDGGVGTLRIFPVARHPTEQRISGPL